MKIWLVTIGEPIPDDGPQIRLLRTGLFAQHMANRGHQVTWWNSTFDHQRKKQRFAKDTVLRLMGGVEVRLLHGCGYAKNISLLRIVDHWLIARAFSFQAAVQPVPDVIVCSLPTVGLCDAALVYGSAHGIPVLLDIRDLWPDVFLSAMPSALRLVGRLMLLTTFAQARSVSRRASGLIGISPGYLEWSLRLANRARLQCDAMLPLGYPPAPTLDSIKQPVVRADLEALGVNFNRRLYVFVGSMGATYDLSTCIEAARIMSDEGVQFVFAGDGENRAAWQKQAAGVSNVCFTGWIDGAAISLLLSQAHAGIAAYTAGATQGLPNKLYEYMAYGLPAISSLPGEARHLLESVDIGRYYEAGDVRGFVRAAEDLRPQALRSEMGSRALALFHQHYSSEVVMEKFMEHLTKAVSSLGTGTNLSNTCSSHN